MENNLLSQLGLVFGPTGGSEGAITGIDLPISPSPLLAQGMQRRVRLKRLTFDHDLEISVIFELYIVDSEGQDLYQLYSQDGSLSPFVQRERLARVQPIEIPRTTRGSFRDTGTGQLVTTSRDNEGMELPNVTSELYFFQTMALAHLQAQGLPLTGTEPYLVVVYLMLANIIREKDALGEF